MSTNINSTTRHLKFSYISILTNLLRTDNETESVKTIESMLKVKNLIKNTPSKLHHILQRRDFCKNSQTFIRSTVFCKKLHLRSLAGILIHVVK